MVDLRDLIFVDTNVFLRFLTGDPPAMAASARALFESAMGGQVRLVTSTLVVAEIVWTLESFYRLDKRDIANKVSTILETPGLECSDVEVVLSALDFYADKNVDFIDGYHVFKLQASGINRIATFDRKHFKRAPQLEMVDLGT